MSRYDTPETAQQPFIELGFDLQRCVTRYESLGGTAHVEGHCLFWNQGGVKDRYALPVELLVTMDDRVLLRSRAFHFSQEAVDAWGLAPENCLRERERES